MLRGNHYNPTETPRIKPIYSQLRADVRGGVRVRDAVEVLDGIVYESVVTTYDDDGTPHSASMGVRFFTSGSEDLITLRPHVSSRTYHNVLLRKCGVVNVVDPLMIVECALDLNVLDRVYLRAESVDAPRLRDSYVWVEFAVLSFSRDGEWGDVRCKVTFVGQNERRVQPFSRAAAALVEAAVAASRLEVYLSRGDHENFMRLAETMSNSINLAMRLGRGTVIEHLAAEVARRYSFGPPSSSRV